MKLSALLQQFKMRFRRNGWPQFSPNEEPPLRSELFSADQMEQHGRSLAASHPLASGNAPDQLLARLADNENVLIGVCKLLTTSSATKRRATPAGEWLLDNFYLIEEQIRTTKRHLPKGYSRELPRLEKRPSGRPRVYEIALEIIAHGDGRVDTEGLSRFVAAYQNVSALKLGELWAIPIMLRLAIIENLRRVGVRIAAGWAERNLADSWADQMAETAEQDPKSLILVIADMARSAPPMVSAFVAELARRLQGRGPSLALPLTWIEQRLAESGLTIEQMVQSENQQQAADQVSISNSIGSLRLLGAMDWREFVETMSVVEQTLLEDPSGVYGRMDFATRDHYRHATEAIARKSPLSEGEIARQAITLAKENSHGDFLSGERGSHVGYFLIDKGRTQLELIARVRHSGIDALRVWAARHPLPLYLGGITLITLLISGLLLAETHSFGVDVWLLVLLSAIALVASSQLAVAWVNWLATLLVNAHPLPRMDFSTGISARSRTLVVVPTMLSSPQNLDELIEALEVRFLANRDERLHFGLLTDFLDADLEAMPGDAKLVALAKSSVEALNLKYGCGKGLGKDDIFFLFHRPRLWNPQQQRWMGGERKRGKLADLNALLRGADHAGFSHVVGNTTVLSSVQYVITLDTDTQLPRDAARQFVGAMAHPLNRPHYDQLAGRVTEGYGILQPRVAISLPGTNRSLYARLYGGEPGIDPYTRTVSDVYQDVFGEGSFIGKGIYDVDAFEQALSGRFPENRILSHDLLEGCYARSGLLSDVQLYEDCPARYSAEITRRTRWIRGDWQLAGWLLRRVPCQCKEGDSIVHRSANPLSALSQWKLIDNLRRSLVPVALTLMLLLGWSLSASPLLLTGAVIGILLLPTLGNSLLDLLRIPEEVLLRQHVAAVASSLFRHLKQVSFELACLPYEAFVSLDAITRTTWRMLVTHRRLLEWNPSSEVDKALNQSGRSDLNAAYRVMWVAPAVAASAAIVLVYLAPAALYGALPMLLLWALSPALAWYLSRPLVPHRAALSNKQQLFLRALSRRTWAFFDKFVGPEDHWLPPDNYQEYRVAAIAHRTSPTNIGLSLLANLAAYDFGYVTSGKLVVRTANTLRTMDGLERYRGHFYNWYETLTLQPLAPLYVSTVDSGNLAGHLLTLQAGLYALIDDDILAPQFFDGLLDTARLLSETMDKTDKVAAESLADFRKDLGMAAISEHTIPALQRVLVGLANDADELVALLMENQEVSGAEAASASASANPNAEASSIEHGWAHALAVQCHDALDELNYLAPWLALPKPPGGMEDFLTSIAAYQHLPSLRELATTFDALCPVIQQYLSVQTTPGQYPWLADLQLSIREGGARARERITNIERLALEAGSFANMEYEFLFDKTRNLLNIGYNVTERRTDPGYYDLLASEARLCNFVGIAHGQLPQESWFALGRLLTATGGEPALLSWSGSMFEYLMPMLVMPSYENTLLDQTCKAAVARQIEYGKQRGVPWGMSESGYNTVDMHLNYQYRAFGVPGLGLKRGLAEDLVIAPYASVMALMVAPEEACLNLQRMAEEGFMGKFGFFEAIDYTPARQRRGQESVVVRSFMAHHQGMSLLALAYLLLDRPMQKRFESDRWFQAVLLLLQERIPKATALFAHVVQRFDAGLVTESPENTIRVFSTPDTTMPEVQLLSNGRYHVMVTNAGGSYSRWRDLAITRWREDSSYDHWGQFCYIREVASGKFWSSAHQPTLIRPERYEAIFSEGRAEFRRCDVIGEQSGDERVETHTEIVVSPEDDIELRRVHITNRSRHRREIEVTSYGEVVIAPPAADSMHPAFSKLFVQTEIMRDRRAILCTRRPRSLGEQAPWMFHLMVVHGADLGEVSYETDRSRFVGRSRSIASPQVMNEKGALSGCDGSVLDPIVAIRYTLTLAPDQTATIDMVTGVAETRTLAVSLVEKYQDRHLADRVFDLTWSHSQVALRQLNATEADAQLYARLASSVIYANASLRADASVLVRNHRGQSGLWGYAISGDLPIVLLQIADAANIDLVRQLVQAHAYWRQKGLVVDLVIWNEDHAGYRQQLQEQILALIALGIEASVIDRPGGIFVRPAEQISSEDRILFQSVARVVISDSQGSLADQLEQRRVMETRVPKLAPSKNFRPPSPQHWPTPAHDVVLGNGLGGFAPDGHEYIITLAPTQTTPAPWVNVIANPQFGTVISENGLSYTWSENAHEFRLTPWYNDPVSDSSGEAFYLRDEETAHLWSPTPLPCPPATPCVIRHGFGYSVYETREDGIRTELWVYVAIDAAIKFSVLKVFNESGRTRKLSATGYVEWVLGDLRANSAMHVNTEIDGKSGAFTARNPYNTEFADRLAFFDVDDSTRGFTGDRTEFIGRNGTMNNPAALRRTRLSGKVGAGLDPCAAIQISVELEDGEHREIIFRLGVGRNTDEATKLIQRFRGNGAARLALEAVRKHWQHTLGAVQIDTPDLALNILANGWLVYQTMACRLWARSGFYQSGGAFGFRDQLQDVMALIHAEPALVREHLLLCASRQYCEGDVQHWWHPPSGRGVRTHCSDDYLWLPLAVCRYVTVTGDSGILNESASFIEGRPVNAEDDAYYDLPNRSLEVASLYEHCIRAIRHGLRFGSHGLPLMGSGDWNDGMNLVGMQGKGESVWLGFFQCEVLRQFADLACTHGDLVFAKFCGEESKSLRDSLEQHGWDGEWYRRAYFEDGTPLGSKDNTECRIDSISQSWAVLSGAADPVRASLAMQAVNTHLVRRDEGLVQLLTPPFDSTSLDPGYIRGYVPGVRENGGQYTHGAIWATMAFAELGENERAWELMRMINPLNHALSAEAVATYKAEPYVVTADIYAMPPHTGRGGWSWYTGSAGWMYRLIIESLLGLRLEGNRLHLNPCLDADWNGYKLRYRYYASTYQLNVVSSHVGEKPDKEMRFKLDGVSQHEQYVLLVDDQQEHCIEVEIGTFLAT